VNPKPSTGLLVSWGLPSRNQPGLQGGPSIIRLHGPALTGKSPGNRVASINPIRIAGPSGSLETGSSGFPGQRPHVPARGFEADPAVHRSPAAGRRRGARRAAGPRGGPADPPDAEDAPGFPARPSLGE